MSADVNDIVESLKFAAENALRTAIMGAGHQVVGVQLLPNGLTIDTSNLTAIEVDPDTETAYVQAGILRCACGFSYSRAVFVQAAFDCVLHLNYAVYVIILVCQMPCQLSMSLPKTAEPP